MKKWLNFSFKIIFFILFMIKNGKKGFFRGGKPPFSLKKHHFLKNLFNNFCYFLGLGLPMK